MPTTTTLARVGRFEFFSVLTPGFHILIVLVFLWLGFGDQGDATSAWDRIRPLVETLTEHWPLAVVVLFAAYLLGSIPRAMSVTRLDRGWTKKVGRAFAGTGWSGKLFETEFPYREALRSTRDSLERNGLVIVERIPTDDETAHTMFNFWKMSICINAQDAFAYTQSLEERVRLFAGMIRSGVFGLFGAIVLLIACLASPREIGSIWLAPSAGLLAISLVMATTFSIYLRRLRGWEANHVYLAYVSYRNRDQTQITSPPTP